MSQYSFFYTLLLLSGLKLSSFPSFHTKTELAAVEELAAVCDQRAWLVLCYAPHLRHDGLIHWCHGPALLGAAGLSGGGGGVGDH